jgi:hypothetical protein
MVKLLLYIGKSNKIFTHNKTYKYNKMCYKFATTDHWFEPIINFYVSVYYNSYQMVVFKDEEYFERKFKLMTEHEHNQYIRKIKLKKLNNDNKE